MKVKFEPTQAATKGLNKHIRESLRAFPVADLAKTILKSRDRYQVRFESEESGPQLYRCKDDNSVWLSREEAVSHLLSEGALDRYYDVEEVDVGAPSGNFAQIAVCGMSGTLLGPPNHHEYQRNVMRLHAEKFSNMSLERFKSRIEMQSDEEVIEKWKESVSKRKQYRLKTEKTDDEEIPGSDGELVDDIETASGDATSVPTVGEDAVENLPSDEADAGDDSNEEDVTSEEETTESETDLENREPGDGEEESAPEEEKQNSEAAEEASEKVEPKEDVLVLKSEEELSRHFKTHVAGDAIEEARVALVPGDIPGRALSRDLLELIKRESESLRRGFPLAMVQALCSALEKEGLRFFKRGKKALHVSAVRPRPIKDSVSFSNEVQAVVDYILKHSGARVLDLLNELADDFVKPEKSAPAESQELTDGARRVLKDLRWLTSEGYLIELPDTRIVMGVAPRNETGGQAPSKKGSRNKGAAKKKAVSENEAEKAGKKDAEVANVTEDKADVPVGEGVNAIEQEQGDQSTGDASQSGE